MTHHGGLAGSLSAEYYYGDIPRRGSLAVFQDPVAEVFPHPDDDDGPEEPPKTPSLAAHAPSGSGVGISGAPVIAEPAGDEPAENGAGETETSEKEPKKTTLPWGQIFVLLCVTLSESVQVQILVSFELALFEGHERRDMASCASVEGEGWDFKSTRLSTEGLSV